MYTILNDMKLLSLRIKSNSKKIYCIGNLQKKKHYFCRTIIKKSDYSFINYTV